MPQNPNFLSGELRLHRVVGFFLAVYLFFIGASFLKRKIWPISKQSENQVQLPSEVAADKPSRDEEDSEAHKVIFFSPPPEGRSHKYECEISFSASSSIFPESWIGKPYFAKAYPIKASEKMRAKKVIKTAMSRYPSSIIEDHLGGVFLLGGLRFYDDLKYGGTFAGDEIYLAVGSSSEGYTNAYVEGCFHHEFSSVLLAKHLEKFNKSRWLNLNPKGFKYRGRSSWENAPGDDGGVLALKENKASLVLNEDSKKLDHGFLNEYSLSSLENDFNEYAAKLFYQKTDFWNLAKKHVGVREKMKIVIEFYSDIDDRMALELVERLSFLNSIRPN